ncbi:unnamed protein product [Umbelopsis ramanniana]
MDPTMAMQFQQRAAGHIPPQHQFSDVMPSSDPAINTPPQSDQLRAVQANSDKAVFNKPFQGPLATRPDPYKKLPVTNVTGELQEKNLQQYLHRDKVYQKSLEVQHRRHMQLAHSKKAQLEAASMEKKARHQGLNVFGPGYKGYGNSKFPVQNSILYPREKRKQRRMTNYTVNMRAISAQADQEDVLVPVRIDMESNGYQLRDTFTWNLNEKLLTPERFADILCEDLHLPPAQFVDAIVASIREQLEEYHLYAPNAHMKEPEQNKAAEVVEQVNGVTTDSDQVMTEATEPTASESLTTQTEPASSTSAEEELRIIIKLDITVGNISLVDQFEWSIENSSDSPELFAEKLVSELGLGGEFKSAISHSIREQVYVHFKSLLIGQDYDGNYLSERVKNQLLPSFKSLLRDPLMAEKFTPVLLEISDLELDRIEREKLREFRRKRRQNRSSRRGINLPERESLRTHRTGVAIPQMTEGNEEGGPGAGAENGRGGESSWYGRKSALKARMNIAAEARMSGYRDSLSPVPTNAQLENGLPMSDGLGSYSVGRYSSNSGNPYQPAGMRDSIRDGHGHDINGPSAYATSNMDSNSLYPTPTPHNIPKPEAELPEGATIAKHLLDWMPSKKRILQTRNPHDVFDIVQLDNGDYKVFCYDCPNKLYTIGPNETLKNFEVHLRNRSHRNSVEARLRAAW